MQKSGGLMQKGGEMTLKKTGVNVFHTLLDLVFPQNLRCHFCESELPPHAEDPICGVCSEAFVFLEDYLCHKCGRRIEAAYDQYEPYAFKCKECQEQFHFFTKHRSYSLYQGNVIQALMGLKYKRQVYQGKFLGKCLAKMVETDPELHHFDHVVPVPAHFMRQLRRGYNQSEILAIHMCKTLGINAPTQLIVRKRSTKKLKTLGRDSRKLMMNKAFVVKPTWHAQVRNKTILLVDDIYTTGATLNACSQALYEAGAEKIICVTVARGL